MRIIDANLNRLGEGLRFMEEIARFVLDDPLLTSELKNLRHRLSPQDPTLKSLYLDARNSAADIGPAITLGDKEGIRDLTQAIVANARRAEESLRILEELAKTAGAELDETALQEARFAVYTLEKTLIARLLRQDKTPLICGLHSVVDTANLGGYPPAEVTHEILRGGARVIRLRDKLTPKPQILDLAREIAALCHEYGAIFIVNNALDIALAAGADGLHLEEDDLPVSIVRKLLPMNRLVGRSVQSLVEARCAQTDGADYLEYGADWAINTAPGSSVPHCLLLAQIKKAVNLPVIALGDITQHNVTEILHAGADGLAVTNLPLAPGSIETATCRIIKAMEVPRESAQPQS